MSSPVEGQEIARSLLESERALLTARATPDNKEGLRAATKAWEFAWHHFWRAYGGRLLRIARQSCERIPSLGGDQAGDLVQEFLVMVRRKRDTMFGVVTRNEKPLWP